MRRGLLYEDAPENVKGPGQSIIIDQRVNNLEMATQEFLRRLEVVQNVADKLRAGGKP